jgi:hypothetical protein
VLEINDQGLNHFPQKEIALKSIVESVPLATLDFSVSKEIKC